MHRIEQGKKKVNVRRERERYEAAEAFSIPAYRIRSRNDEVLPPEGRAEEVRIQLQVWQNRIQNEIGWDATQRKCQISPLHSPCLSKI